MIVMATLISAYFTKAKLEQMLASADKGIQITIAVNDECNAYQQNASIYLSQSKEQRESKAPKTYVGNGQVVWIDGKVTVAPKKDIATLPREQDANAIPGASILDDLQPLPF